MSSSPIRPRLRTYGFAALLLTVAADGLFFGTWGRPVGLSAPVFLASIAGAVLLCRRRSIDQTLSVPFLLLIVALLALVETVDQTSLAVAVVCLAAFALAASKRLPFGLEAVPALGRFLLRAPLALFGDDRRRRSVALKMARRRRAPQQRSRAWLVWTMPVILACAFVLLLAAGNPILERWLAQLDPFILLNVLNPTRILFWALVITLVWPFLRPRLLPRLAGKTEKRPWTAHGTSGTTTNVTSLVYGPAAILRVWPEKS